MIRQTAALPKSAFCRSRADFLAAVTIGAIMVSCAVRTPQSADVPSTPPSSDDADHRARDEQDYRDLQETLAKTAVASVIPEDAAMMNTSATALYFLRFPNYAPTLNRWSSVDGKHVTYSFSVGSGDDYNYRVSDELVVTAETRSGIFHAYAADQANKEIGIATPEVPASGQKWWSYAVDGKSVYYVTEVGDTVELWTWQPPQKPELLHSFNQGTGKFGEIADIGVDSGELVIIASTGLWRVDLKTFEPHRANLKKEIGSNVSMNNGAITFETVLPAGAEIQHLAKGSDDPIDLGAAIAASPYRLDATYPTAHIANEHGFTVWGDWLIYCADLGLFAMRLDTYEIRPLLLLPLGSDSEANFNHPYALPNGTLVVNSYAGTEAGRSMLQLDLKGVLQ